MNKNKKFLSVFLAVLMLMSIVPMSDMGIEASAFSERTTAPSSSNSCYYGSANGYSVGQCTWYAFGRAYEILGWAPNFGSGNANKWYSNNVSSGNFKYGSTPKVGSIMVTQKTSTSGHVAVVERLNSDGTMLISEYNWDVSLGFGTKTLSQSATTRGSHTVLGYIYLLDSSDSGSSSEPIITTITFNPAGGTAGGITGDTSFALEYGKGNYNDVSGLYPSKTGYSFLGWFTSDTGGDMVYDANGIAVNDGIHWDNGQSIFPYNYAVYAHWKSNNYTVTFNPAGGTAGGTSEDTTFILEYGTGNYNDVSGLYPSKTGYSFLGWFTSDTGGDMVYDANGIAVNDGIHWDNGQSIFPYNYAVYAHWKPNNYTVTFNPAGGTAGGTSEDTTFILEYGTGNYNDVSGLYPSKIGYSFLGWFTSDIGGDMVYDANGIAVNDGIHWDNGESIFPYNYAVYAHWSCKHGTTEIKNAKSATCTAEGYTGDTYCKTCGVKTKSGTVIAKTAHNSNTTIPAVAATCTKTGLTEGKKCSVCGTVTVAQQTVAKTAHSYTSKVTTAATCKAEGVKTYTCSACSASYTEKIAKNASNHTGGTEIKNAKSASCTAEGYTGDTYCKGCGAKIKSGTVIAKLAHKYTSEIVKQPTCNEKGLEIFSCKCGDSYTKEIKATGHSYGDDGICKDCDDYNAEADKNNESDSDKNCSHICHKTGFMGFIWKILLFIFKLFKISPVCDCGVAHY